MLVLSQCFLDLRHFVRVVVLVEARDARHPVVVATFRHNCTVVAPPCCCSGRCSGCNHDGCSGSSVVVVNIVVVVFMIVVVVMVSNS